MGGAVRRGQLVENGVQTRCEPGRGGICDDIGEGTVEIEQHRGGAAADQVGDPRPEGERIRRIRHSPESAAHPNPRQILDHDIGAARA